MKKLMLLAFVLICMLGLAACSPGQDAPVEESAAANLADIAVEEPLDLEQSSGVGVEIAYESEDMLIFYGEFGLFGYNLKTEELEFSVDFVKTVGIEGSVQGSYGTAVDVSSDGSKIVISEYNVETDERGACCEIDLSSRTYEKGAYQPMDDLFDRESAKGSIYPGVKIAQVKYTLDGREWSLFE